MPGSTSLGVSYPLPGELVRSPSVAAKLQGDLQALAITADTAIRVQGAATDAATQAKVNAAVARIDQATTAYDVAVANGFAGTVAQWLASLVGPPGPAGDEEAVQEAIDAAIASFDTDLMGTAAGRAVPAYAASPAPSSGGDMRAPSVLAEHNLIQSTAATYVDGTRFAGVLNVGALPGTWMDQWYAYVAGHDSPAIWLWTAPSLLGPWVEREAVVGVPGSGARVTDDRIKDHASSPDAIYVDGKIRLVYHGPLAENWLEQPSFMAASADGVNFTLGEKILPTEYANEGSPYRTSTSYAGFARHAGVWHAVWQGTTGRNYNIDGYSSAPMPVGHGVSADGLSWSKLPPILSSVGKDQGLFAPGISRIAGGWLMAGTYRMFNGTGQTETVRAYWGESLDELHYVGDIVLPGDRPQSLTTPKFVAVGRRFYMVAGTRATNGGVPQISAFELDWSA